MPVENRLTAKEAMKLPLFANFDFDNTRELFPKNEPRAELKVRHRPVPFRSVSFRTLTRNCHT